MRKIVAVFFHLPGLRLFFGAKATPGLVRSNMQAVAGTLAAMMVAALITKPPGQLYAVFVVWCVGHFGWGVYLSTKA